VEFRLDAADCQRAFASNNRPRAVYANGYEIPFPLSGLRRPLESLAASDAHAACKARIPRRRHRHPGEDRRENFGASFGWPQE